MRATRATTPLERYTVKRLAAAKGAGHAMLLSSALGHRWECTCGEASREAFSTATWARAAWFAHVRRVLAAATIPSDGRDDGC